MTSRVVCRFLVAAVLAFAACKGDQGIPGLQGEPGQQGAVGATGPAGPQGPTGTFNTSPGAILLETLDRGGAITDVARGVPTTITAGTKVGFGPTSELAAGNYWETTVIGSRLTVDLGADQAGVFAIVFESHPRGDATNIPEFTGASAYVLEHSRDNFATAGVAVPAANPAQGDIFIHRLATPVTLRQVRLTTNGPRTIPNPVRISMLRVLTHLPGDATRIDARRLYGGPLPCRAGFVPVSDGRICMEPTMRPAANMHLAIAACKAAGPGARVCTHNDFQQACGSGLAPYNGVAAGWYGEHGQVAGGDFDDEFITWNMGGCADNNDGAAQHAAGIALPYKCCY